MISAVMMVKRRNDQRAPAAFSAVGMFQRIAVCPRSGCRMPASVMLGTQPNSDMNYDQVTNQHGDETVYKSSK